MLKNPFKENLYVIGDQCYEVCDHYYKILPKMKYPRDNKHVSCFLDQRFIVVTGAD